MNLIKFAVQLPLIPILWLLVFFRHLFGDIYGVIHNRILTANYETMVAYTETLEAYYEDF